MAFNNLILPHAKNRTMKRFCRNRVKLLLFLIFLTFVLVCFGPIFFLPDLRGGLSTKAGNMYKVYKETIQKAAPELIIPPPPPQESVDGYIRNHEGLPRKNSLFNDIHILEDKQRLQNKINNEVLEKPLLLSFPTTKKNILLGLNNDINQLDKKIELVDDNNKQVPPPQIGAGNEIRNSQPGMPVIQGGEDKDPEVRKKRDKIKEV